MCVCDDVGAGSYVDQPSSTKRTIVSGICVDCDKFVENVYFSTAPAKCFGNDRRSAPTRSISSNESSTEQREYTVTEAEEPRTKTSVQSVRALASGIGHRAWRISHLAPRIERLSYANQWSTRKPKHAGFTLNYGGVRPYDGRRI